MTKKLKKKDTLQAIIKTLCYAEIFSYPLTSSEIWRYVISQKRVSKSEIQKTLLKNKNVFQETDGYFTMSGRSNLVQVRQARLIESRKKIVKALWISAILMYIPTIKLVGISGSLSMYNANKQDDIDLFFVTQKHTLWISRMCVALLLALLGEKRSRRSNLAVNKICPNMFLSESTLSLSKSNRNIYTAHEVAQLKVLYSRNNMYENFLQENKWALQFLPNAFSVSKKTQHEKKISLSSIFLSPFDYVLFLAQYIYMKKGMKQEKISRNVAMFHPVKKDKAIASLLALKVKHRKHKKGQTAGQIARERTLLLN